MLYFLVEGYFRVGFRGRDLEGFVLIRWLRIMSVWLGLLELMGMGMVSRR